MYCHRAYIGLLQEAIVSGITQIGRHSTTAVLTTHGPHEGLYTLQVSRTNLIFGSLGSAHYSIPNREAQYCDDGVCLFVYSRVWVFLYPQAYLPKYTSNLHQCFVYVTYRRSSVVLWQRSDTLCTSVLWMTSYLLIIQGCSTSTSLPSRSASSPDAALGYKQCAVIPAAGKRTHRPKSTFRALKITPQLAAHRVGVCDLLLLCFV